MLVSRGLDDQTISVIASSPSHPRYTVSCPILAMPLFMNLKERMWVFDLLVVNSLFAQIKVEMSVVDSQSGIDIFFR